MLLMMGTRGGGPALAALLVCFWCCSLGGVHSIPERFKEQVDRSREDVSKILQHILHGEGRHQTYERLAELGDRFGHRLSGSESLEKAINYTIEHMSNITLQNIVREPVMVPRWTRGREQGSLTVPAYGWTRSIEIMALGEATGTNGVTLTAPGLLVNSIQQLNDTDSALVAGKIVIFNAPKPWVSYNTQYRSWGAQWAQAKGAVGALLRSVTANSIYSAHTGVSEKANIPFAAITLEDAELMERIQERGLEFSVSIYMEAQNHPPSQSHNAIGEIRGSEKPDELVLIGGHIDTWDVTDGSMDDGGGVMMAWEAVTVLTKLGLIPRKTIRLIMWTSEEFGFYGALEHYRQRNATDLSKMTLALQADGGSFFPYGIRFTGSDTAREIMEYIMETMLVENNTTQVCPGSGRSSDTGVWVDNGVPGVELCNANENYFDFHHTRGDSMLVLDPDHLDQCTAIWAVVAYVIANMDDMLPRGSTTPSVDTTTTDASLTQPVVQHVLLLSVLSSFFAVGYRAVMFQR